MPDPEGKRVEIEFTGKYIENLETLRSELGLEANSAVIRLAIDLLLDIHTEIKLGKKLGFLELDGTFTRAVFFPKDWNRPRT